MRPRDLSSQNLIGTISKGPSLRSLFVKADADIGNKVNFKFESI